MKHFLKRKYGYFRNCLYLNLFPPKNEKLLWIDLRVKFEVFKEQVNTNGHSKHHTYKPANFIVY